MDVIIVNFSVILLANNVFKGFVLNAMMAGLFLLITIVKRFVVMVI